MRNFLANKFANLFWATPFIMAFGAALYFTINFEPSIPFARVICVIMIVVAFISRVPTIIRGVALFIFGFCYAYAFTNFIDTPQITRNIHNIDIVGTVRNIDYTADKSRIYMDVAARDININRDAIATVRVSQPLDAPAPDIGDKISARIGLFRPGAADAVGGFDYARWSYFNNLTATGYMDDYNVIKESNAANVNSVRKFLHRKSESFLVDGLVLGYGGALSREHRETWTRAGIGHVWAISGLHMTLVSGWLFAMFYFLFRRIPYITRRVPARIPATVCAWMGLIAYMMISGTSIATIRAFAMISLIFFAFILGRNAISMRNACIAFCIIFLMNPHFVMQAGFQLSFAAIFGLIWFWNIGNPKMPENKFLKIVCVAATTSIVATAGTLPFVVAHFHMIPTYGLISNLVLLPIFSVLIMPLVLVGACLAPFGVHTPISIAEFVYNYAFEIANWICGLPASSITVGDIPNSAICIIIIGFMALILIKSSKYKINYMTCGACVLTGIIISATAPRPIFLATHDHELIAFADGDKIAFNKSSASNHYFTFDTWRVRTGITGDTKNTRLKHKSGVYRFNTPNFNLVYIQKFVPLMNNIATLCRDDGVDYIVSYFRITAPACDKKILRGGFEIYKSGDVRYIPTNRRWHHNPRG